MEIGVCIRVLLNASSKVAIPQTVSSCSTYNSIFTWCFQPYPTSEMNYQAKKKGREFFWNKELIHFFLFLFFHSSSKTEHKVHLCLLLVTTSIALIGSDMTSWDHIDILDLAMTPEVEYEVSGKKTDWLNWLIVDAGCKQDQHPITTVGTINKQTFATTSSGCKYTPVHWGFPWKHILIDSIFKSTAPASLQGIYVVVNWQKDKKGAFDCVCAAVCDRAGAIQNWSINTRYDICLQFVYHVATPFVPPVTAGSYNKKSVFIVMDLFIPSNYISL